MERSEEERRASYLNMIDAVERLSRGEKMTEEWEYMQLCELRELAHCYDFSHSNLERQDTEFRTQAADVDRLLRALVDTFDAQVYLSFCKGVLRMLAMLEDEEDLIESFTKLCH
jgi:glycyl-tRNA synthetase alpha subunit